MSFRRALDTGDADDMALTAGPTNVIWAIHSSKPRRADGFLATHSVRERGAVLVDLMCSLGVKLVAGIQLMGAGTANNAVDILRQQVSGECGCTPRSVRTEINGLSGHLDVEVMFEEADLAAVTDLTQAWTQTWNTGSGTLFCLTQITANIVADVSTQNSMWTLACFYTEKKSRVSDCSGISLAGGATALVRSAPEMSSLCSGPVVLATGGDEILPVTDTLMVFVRAMGAWLALAVIAPWWSRYATRSWMRTFVSYTLHKSLPLWEVRHSQP